ncbi:MAG: endonuclease domain-containing protein [Bacteroidota bacterium]
MPPDRLKPKAFRRALRQQANPAEHRFWSLARDRRLAGLKFRRQHTLGSFVVDFYCHAHGLVIELDGSVHDDPQRARYDGERQRALERAGLTVMRFTNDEVMEQSGAVVTAICAYAGLGDPSPCPSPRGEGTS